MLAVGPTIVFDKPLVGWRETAHAVSVADSYLDELRRAPKTVFVDFGVAAGANWNRLSQWLSAADWQNVDLGDYSAFLTEWHDFVIQDVKERASKNLMVVEGLHRSSILQELAHWSLSRKAAERTFDALRSLLLHYGETQPSSLFLSVRVLIIEASADVRCRILTKPVLRPIPTMREWARSFSVHTGSSPPESQTSQIADLVLGNWADHRFSSSKDQIEHLIHLVFRGRHAFNRRPTSGANHEDLRQLSRSQINRGRRSLEGKLALGCSRLVDNRQVYGRRQATEGSLRRAARRSLGGHLRMGLRRQSCVPLAA